MESRRESAEGDVIEAFGHEPYLNIYVVWHPRFANGSAACSTLWNNSSMVSLRYENKSSFHVRRFSDSCLGVALPNGRLLPNRKVACPTIAEL
jgi:hypothetical protein